VGFGASSRDSVVAPSVRQSFGLFSIIVCLAILAGLLRPQARATYSSLGQPIPVQVPVWTACREPVAHALGAIDGVAYTNSLEAFAASYAKGFRVFEIDLARTRDGSIVAMHDWRNTWHTLPNLAEFKAHRIAGRYTAATLDDILSILQSHPDVYLIVDFKGEVPDLLAGVVAATRTIDPRLLRRIVPQVSSKAEAEAAGRLYRFPSEILTLYRTRASDDEVVGLTARTGIGVVTMSTMRLNEGLVRRLDSLGVKVYVHTVNDRDSAGALRAKGVWGIYTDTLRPDPKGERCGSDSATSP
jgi:glycerophosphoryl diester phosphodiesterase